MRPARDHGDTLSRMWPAFVFSALIFPSTSTSAPPPLTFDIGPIVTNASMTFGTDPTETVTRFELRNDWQRRHDGAEADILTARLDVGLFERFLFRADIPGAHVSPNGASSDAGIGDMRAQLGWRAFEDPLLSMYFGLGFVLNTAAEDSLGDGWNQIVPMVAASGSLPEIRSRLFETIEHFVSFSGDGDRTGIANTKTQVRLMTEWSDTIWTQAGGTFVIDWKSGEQTGLALDLEIGHMLGKNVGVWIRPGFRVFGEDIPGIDDWSVQVGLRWLL